MILVVAFAAFLSTLFGGFFALHLRDRLHLILGFSAGAVIAVALFDLLPEALALGGAFFKESNIIAVVAVGFFVYLLLDRLAFFHAHHSEHYEQEHGLPRATSRGTLGAAALSAHSFLDGLAIGLAFQVSAAVGAVVAVAVLVHDFSDGINTVGLITKNGGAPARARAWLFVDALAPVAGAASTLFFTLSQGALALVLALFAGFFLYIGASDLIPESHHAHPKFLTTAMTLLGALVLFAAIRLANI